MHAYTIQLYGKQIHFNGPPTIAVKNAGEHDDTLLGEGEEEILAVGSRPSL